MMREIGSEFHWVDRTNVDVDSTPDWLSFDGDKKLCFSGRTAIETVIEDIGCIKKVLLPSYCCDSMIEPFRHKNLEIEFYSVDYDDGLKIHLEIPSDCDAVLWCNYFGYRGYYPQKELSAFRSKGGIVIEDITHSILLKNIDYSRCDYAVASLRKIGPTICGGICIKFGSNFKNVSYKSLDTEFVSKKSEAMKLKREYLISGNEEKKIKFLSLFAQTNEWLSHNYTNRSMDDMSKAFVSSWNIEEIKERRRSNALFLHSELNNKSDIVTVFDFNDGDIPLFVPVVCKNRTERDNIRNELINNRIYCPIHWPRPKACCESNLYDIELSIVCDQRYTIDDMRYIISVLCR